MTKSGPKILLFDVETAPMLAYVWSLWQDGIGLDMMHKDWFILSWAAKWLDDKKVMYHDQSKCKNMEDDKELMKKLWKLLDEADIVITQNGIKFDHKKVNARFIIHGMKPPSPYKMVDTLVMAKKNFAFTSNKLEYLSNNLNKKYTKLTKGRKFHGFDLWRECLKGNKSAWAEMKKYNIRDVHALEETFKVLAPWDVQFNRNLYTTNEKMICPNCGKEHYKRDGYHYTSSGKYQRYQCLDCGSRFSGKENLLSKDKRKNVPRIKNT